MKCVGNKIIKCPTYGHQLAEWIEKYGVFKVKYEKGDRKNSDDLFQLPIRTICNAKNCHREFKTDSELTGELVCHCSLRGRLIASPYKAKVRTGKWVKLHLPCVNTIDCFNARLKCRNKNCETRLFLNDFVSSKKILPSHTEVNSSWTEYNQDGTIFARSMEDFPQEVIDEMV